MPQMWGAERFAVRHPPFAIRKSKTKGPSAANAHLPARSSLRMTKDAIRNPQKQNRRSFGYERALVCAFCAQDDIGSRSVVSIGILSCAQDDMGWECRMTLGRGMTVPRRPDQNRKVQRSLIAIRSLCASRLRFGLGTIFCQFRFQMTNRSLPGLMVHRKRLLVPTVLESVSY